MAARAKFLALTIAAATAVELTIKYPGGTPLGVQYARHLTGECAAGANCLRRECNEQNRFVVDGVEQEDCTPECVDYCDPYGTSWCEVGADGRFRAHQEVKDAHATNDACTAVGVWVAGEGTSTAACGEWGQETTCSTFEAPSPPPSEPASPLYPSSARCENYCSAAACAAILFGPCKRWRGSLHRYEECDPSYWENDPGGEPATIEFASETEGLDLVCADADTTTGASACVDYLDTFLTTTKIINFQPQLARPFASLRNVCLFTQQCSGVCPSALCTDMIEGRCYDGNCVIADYGATCADSCVNFLETEHTGSWDRRQLAGGFIDNSEPGMLNVRQECDAHRTWTTILIVIVVVGVVAVLGTIGAIIGCLFCCGCIKRKKAVSV